MTCHGRGALFLFSNLETGDARESRSSRGSRHNQSEYDGWKRKGISEQAQHGWSVARIGKWGIERIETVLQVLKLSGTSGDEPKSTSRGPES